MFAVRLETRGSATVSKNIFCILVLVLCSGSALSVDLIGQQQDRTTSEYRMDHVLSVRASSAGVIHACLASSEQKAVIGHIASGNNRESKYFS